MQTKRVVLLVGVMAALAVMAVQAQRNCSRQAPAESERLSGVQFLPSGGHVAHGSRQLYRCGAGMVAVGGKLSAPNYADVLCHDGKWAPRPRCVGAVRSCERRATSSDVTFLPSLGDAPNGERQLYRCPSAFIARGAIFTASEYGLVECIGGRWYPEPDCVGAPCQRKGNALVRFSSGAMADHGTKERFVCSDDSRTVDNTDFGFTTCTNGTWLPTPRCFPRGCLNGFETFENKYCSGEPLIRNWLKRSLLDCTEMCNKRERCVALQHDGNYCKIYEGCRLTTSYWNTYKVYKKTDQCKTA